MKVVIKQTKLQYFKESSLVSYFFKHVLYLFNYGFLKYYSPSKKDCGPYGDSGINVF